MTNKEIYKKTLTFSIRKLLIDFLSIVILAAFCVLGFIIIDKTTGMGLIGLGIGLMLGIVAVALISHFISYALKAGQIAMMTKGVAEGKLPDNVYQEGKAIVKKRFKTVAAYFAVTRVIKGIFNQIGRLITDIGNAVGGDTGNTIGSVISSIIQIIVSYLCDCCLGWVFYRESQGSAKATCEGAVIFFKHGKTLAKNLGRIFGIGIGSFIVIGGAFFGIFYGIFLLIPGTFQTLANEIAEAGVRLETDVPEFFTNPSNLSLIIAALLGIIVWSILYSTFIHPFVLTGVLRNYIESGKNDIPTEDSFKVLDSKSSKFTKLHREMT